MAKTVEGDGTAAAVAALPESWETADLDGQMRNLMLQPVTSAGYPQNVLDAWEDATHNKAKSGSGPETMAAAGSSTSRASVSILATPAGFGKNLEEMDVFLKEALQNPRDRITILRMEQDIEKFMRNPKQQVFEFQTIGTSYYRLAAHRVAQHYQLHSTAGDVSVGEMGRIVVRKTPESCFPAIRLADVPESASSSVADGPKKLIQRPRSNSASDLLSVGSTGSKLNPTKTVEERKEEYERARARIFATSSSVGSPVSNGSSPASGARSTQPDKGLSAPPALQSMTPATSGLLTSGSNPGAARAGTEWDKVDKKVPNSTRITGSGRGFGAKEEGGERDGGGRRGGAGAKAGGRGNIDQGGVGGGGGRGRGRVAIFRDREKDRQDPDYHRGYDRYSQRFDPGFGVATAQMPAIYGVQPVYAPVITYDSEFPTLDLGGASMSIAPGSSHPSLGVAMDPSQGGGGGGGGWPNAAQMGGGGGGWGGRAGGMGSAAAGQYGRGGDPRMMMMNNPPQYPHAANARGMGQGAAHMYAYQQQQALAMAAYAGAAGVPPGGGAPYLPADAYQPSFPQPSKPTRRFHVVSSAPPLGGGGSLCPDPSPPFLPLPSSLLSSLSFSYLFYLARGGSGQLQAAPAQAWARLDKLGQQPAQPAASGQLSQRPTASAISSFSLGWLT
eukprot:jgi/Mesen1/6975/ME000361S06119